MSDTVRQQAEREAAASRVMARADRLAALSETADALTRVYLSPEHLQANQLVGQWMQAAGMMVWQDSVGNICGRYEGQQEGRRRCCWALILTPCATPDATTACSACWRRLRWSSVCTSRGDGWRRQSDRRLWR